MNKKFIISLCLAMAVLSAMARKRKVNKSHTDPWQRSLNSNINSLGEEFIMPELQTNTQTLFLRPTENYAAEEGRFLKHIFLLKRLKQSQANYPGHMLPYLIINNPIHLKNINNNSLNNGEAGAGNTTGGGTGPGTGTGTFPGTSTDTPTPTGTAPATNPGTITPAPGTRFALKRANQALQSYASSLPMATPVFQQRQQLVPQIVYGVPLTGANQNKSKRKRNSNKNRQSLKNPNKRNNNPVRRLRNNIGNVKFI